MVQKISILGTVDLKTYNGVESVYAIIEELAVAGVNGICFSIHTNNEPKIEPFGQYEWQGIKNYCEALNIEFIGRPCALGAVECFEKIGVQRYRIAAEEVGNFPLLEKLARTGKELIISAPPGLDWELERMVEFIQPYENNLILMQWMPPCPCNPNEWGLNRIEWLHNHFGYKVGLCDRSGDLFASTAAIALGAEYVEFHFNDYPENIRRRLVEGIRKVETSLQIHPGREDYGIHIAYKSMCDRSLIINKDKKKGSKILLEDIEITENCAGIDVSRYDDVVGKFLCHDIHKGDLINWQLLRNNTEL
ncbi:MAG: N-acetylneuraminate synthase family protein [Bacteroidales bacterium]